MISTIVIDDELLGRYKLQQLLRNEADVQIVGEASSAEEAIELVQLTRPDVMFLNIEMSGVDGFEVITALPRSSEARLPRIIFTSANGKHALRAFEFHAVDYLQKPFSKQRFQEALSRARQELKTTDPEVSRHIPSERLVFKLRGRIVFLALSEINWVRAEGNYVRLWTSKENFTVRSPIGIFGVKLDPQEFLRIHRSTIVNLRCLREISSDDDGREFAVMMDGSRFPVGRCYRRSFRGLMMFFEEKRKPKWLSNEGGHDTNTGSDLLLGHRAVPDHKLAHLGRL